MGRPTLTRLSFAATGRSERRVEGVEKPSNDCGDPDRGFSCSPKQHFLKAPPVSTRAGTTPSPTKAIVSQLGVKALVR
jgi:hypothetical protein